jgi:hypothetical protein
LVLIHLHLIMYMVALGLLHQPFLKNVLLHLLMVCSMATMLRFLHMDRLVLVCTAKPNHAIFFSRILRVDVPWKRYFTELVSVGKNETNITGFCVEVFEAAIKTLNYSIVYIPFGNGVDAPPSYDNLIQQIEIKKLDAVVGDVTITANRAQLVEFTQPFFDSGLVVVVPLKDQDIISFGWDFMKPFSPELWLLIAAAFFISGGLAVYLMERRNNPRFQGHPDKQFGNVKLLSFSTWFGNQDATHKCYGANSGCSLAFCYWDSILLLYNEFIGYSNNPTF